MTIDLTSFLLGAYALGVVAILLWTWFIVIPRDEDHGRDEVAIGFFLALFWPVAVVGILIVFFIFRSMQVMSDAEDIHAADD